MQESSPPAHLSQDDQFSDEQPDGWAGLFDAIATLIEHFRLIVGGTLLVGAVALTVSFVLPKTYTSTSYLGPLEDAAAKTAETIIRSPRVLNDALEKFPEYYAEFGLSSRRQHLNSNLRWQIAKGANPKLALYSVEFTDYDPGRAQSILKVIIDKWLETTAPPPDERAHIEKSLSAAESQERDMSSFIDQLKKRPDLIAPDVKSGYLPPNIADMIRLRTDTLARIEELKTQLKAKSRDLIFEAPDLPTAPSGPRKELIVGVSTIVALGVLIAFVLLQHLLQIAAERPAYASFFQRIDQAIFRRRTRG